MHAAAVEQRAGVVFARRDLGVGLRKRVRCTHQKRHCADPMAKRWAAKTPAEVVKQSE